MAAGEVQVSVNYEDTEDAELLKAAAAQESVKVTPLRGIEPLTTLILAGGTLRWREPLPDGLADAVEKGRRPGGR